MGGCARVLVALMAAAEELDGKEAPSGRRSVNPLTGKKEKAAATEGGEKSKGKEKEGKEGKEKAAPKEKASPSRLQLVLEALEATVALLCAEPSLAPLARRLAMPNAHTLRKPGMLQATSEAVWHTGCIVFMMVGQQLNRVRPAFLARAEQPSISQLPHRASQH